MSLLVPDSFIQWRCLFTIASLFVFVMGVEWPLKTSHTGIFLINELIFWLFPASSYIWPTNTLAAASCGRFSHDSVQPIFPLLGAEEQKTTVRSCTRCGREGVNPFSHQEPAERYKRWEKDWRSWLFRTEISMRSVSQLCQGKLWES